MWSHLSCPVIENIIWIEPLLRGHLSFRSPLHKNKNKNKNKNQKTKTKQNKPKQIKTQQNKTKTKTKNQRKNSYLWNYGFVCLYTYEFWLSLWNIVRSSVILLLPLFVVFQCSVCGIIHAVKILLNGFLSYLSVVLVIELLPFIY